MESCFCFVVFHFPDAIPGIVVCPNKQRCVYTQVTQIHKDVLLDFIGCMDGWVDGRTDMRMDGWGHTELRQEVMSPQV